MELAIFVQQAIDVFCSAEGGGDEANLGGDKEGDRCAQR
jgi:hypothetical protein